jgi:hypothetical protein
MGPPSCMRSVVDRNVGMRRMNVLECISRLRSVCRETAQRHARSPCLLMLTYTRNVYIHLYSTLRTKYHTPIPNVPLASVIKP